MSTTPMSLTQFGQTIKAKHPEYSDMADDEVGQKVLAKYPQYKDMVQTQAVPQQMLDTLRKNINTPAGGANYQPPQTRFADALPENGIMSRATNFLRGTAASVTAPLLHPIETLQGMGQGVVAGGMTPYGTPITAPTGNQEIDQQNEQTHRSVQNSVMDAGAQQIKNAPAYTAGQFAGPVLAGKALSMTGIPAAMLEKMQGKEPPVPSPAEPPARTIMKSIGPREMDMNPLQDAIEKQHGNIAQFAADNKLPMNTRLDYVNAARAYAETQKGFYEDNVLKPVADETVNAPQNFKGYTTGEANNRTTIGSLEQRLRDINTEQNSIHNKANGTLTAEALAKDSDLTAEAAAVRKTLYSEISRRTNMTPEQVQSIREQFGAPHTIADLTERAVNRETAMQTRQERGTTTVPDGRMGVTNLIVNKLRGGPVAIGDRQFRSALQSAQLPASQALQPQIIPQQGTPFQSVWGDTSGTAVPSIVDRGASPAVNTDAIRQALASRGTKAAGRAAQAQSAAEALANRLAARRMMVDASRQ